MTGTRGLHGATARALVGMVAGLGLLAAAPVLAADAPPAPAPPASEGKPAPSKEYQPVEMERGRGPEYQLVPDDRGRFKMLERVESKGLDGTRTVRYWGSTVFPNQYGWFTLRVQELPKPVVKELVKEYGEVFDRVAARGDVISERAVGLLKSWRVDGDNRLWLTISFSVVTVQGTNSRATRILDTSHDVELEVYWIPNAPPRLPEFPDKP